MDKSKWEYKKLKDVCVSIDDGDWIESQDQSSEGIRLIQTGNIGIGEYLDKSDKAKYISEDTFERLKCKEIFSGDCLISRLPDPIGRACILPDMSDRMITAVDCSIVRFKDIIVPDFFVHYTMSRNYNSDINKHATGATRKRISRKNLEGVMIPAPPVADQQRIVAELDCLNEMIALKQEQLKEFDKLARSIFYDMFGDPVTNEKGWDKIKLNDICLGITKGTTPTTLGFSFVKEGVNFVKVESFVGGKLDFSKLTHITQECNMALSRSQLESNDLLICIAGATIGKMAIVDTSILPANTNQACAIVRLKDKNNLRYVHSYLALKLKNDIMKMGKGVAQPNLSLGQLRDFTILLPPLALQQQFAEKIQAIEAQKELVKKSIAETQQLLASRMDYYFN